MGLVPKVAKPKLVPKEPVAPQVTAPPVAERPSNPIKQGLAGLSDAFISGIPTVAGMVGSAGESVYDMATSDKEFSGKNFMEGFDEAAKEGFDKTLFDFGTGARTKTNEILGIKDPVSLEDQAARLLTSLVVPIPGSSSTGILNKLGSFLTPVVRTGAGFGKRAGFQAGIGTAIDQGAKGLTGQPMMLSPEAIGGIEIPSIVGEAEAQTLVPKVTTAPTLVPKVSPTLVPKVTVDQTLQAMEEKVSKQDDYETAKTWGIAVLAILGGASAIKYIKARSLKNLESNAAFGISENEASAIEKVAIRLKNAPIDEYAGILNDARKSGLEFLGEQGVDKSQALANTLRDIGADASTIDHLVSNSHIDVRSLGQRVAETGKFGQGTGLQTHALDKLDLEYAQLNPQQQKLFNEAVDAGAEVNRIRNTRNAKRSLWREGRSDNQLRQMVAAGRLDPQVDVLMKKVSHVFDTHLKYHVKRGTLDVESAIKFRDVFKNADGSNGYVPLYDAKPRTYMQMLRRAFGIHTTKGEELDFMAEFHKRTGIADTKPLNPLVAMRTYNIHSLEHANTSAYQHQALSHLAGVQLAKIAGRLFPTRFVHGSQGFKTVNDINNLPNSPLKDEYLARIDRNDIPITGRETRLIGTASLDDGVENARFKLAEGDKTISNRYSREGSSDYSIDDIKGSGKGEVIVVQHKGELVAYHVPDAATRAAMDINPQLGAKLQFMNHWKKLMTRMTTGDLSVFGPAGHAFASQQVALNTFAREGAWAGIKSVGQSLKGTGAILARNWSHEVARALAHSHATRTGIGGVAPGLSKKFSDMLTNKFENSMLNQVRSETGRIQSSYQADTFSGSLNDFAASTGSQFSGTFGADQMGMVWRMWKGWNNALHEGPAFGAMQKKMGQSLIDNNGAPLSPQQIRDAVDFSKKVAGDMQRIGASDMAKAFNASVPFSAAMVQSWASIGAAAKGNWGKFIAGASTLIGIPTLTEIFHIESLSKQTNPDGTPMTFRYPNTGQNPRLDGKEWTYSDYYWNGLTSNQRVDNFIYMHPGKPPWEAVIMPVSPEWALFRSAVLDGASTYFNLGQEGNLATANLTGVKDEQGRDLEGDLSRHHMFASAQRVLDIPVPPPVAAALSLMGVDFRMGVAFDKSADPEDPGENVSILKAIPHGQGERVTRRSGKTKFANQYLDQNTVAAIQDIFGAAGTLYVGMFEAAHAGLTIGEEPGVAQAFSMSVDAFSNGLQRQARYTNPLFGTALRPKVNDEIAQELFARKEGIKALVADANNFAGGGAVSVNGDPNIGNAVVLPDDPVYIKMVESAKALSQQMSAMDKQIAPLRRQLSIIGNSTNFKSIKERNQEYDATVLEIQRLKAQQTSILIRFEAQASDDLSERFNKDIKVDLSAANPRPNLEGSSLRGLQKKLPSLR
jgi:hypothetical protein